MINELRKMRILVLLLALLWFAACSDDDGSVVLRLDENGYVFSPTKLEGSVEFLPSMKPEAMRVIELDEKLNPIDSFEVSLKKNSDTDFFVESRDYEYPYVKIVTVFSVGNKKMEFAQYVHLSNDNSRLRLNIYGALAADRIEYFVKNKKKSFNQAENQALEELGKVFDIELDDVNERRYNGFSYYGEQLQDLLLYIYCRHEISDSLFYEDFNKFNSMFAEKGMIDSAWVLEAADAWLSTFEILADSADYLFKSVSKDTINYLYWMDEKFFSRAYGIDLTSGYTKEVVNTNRASAFYGRTFVYTSHVKYGSRQSKWRLLSVLEDSLGMCEHQSSYYSTKSIQRNDTIYTCRPESHIWEVITERDSLFNHQYGECSRDQNNGRAMYVHDSLFVCECEDGKCAWNDKYVERVFLESDTMYAKVLDAKATARFGKCAYGNFGDMLKLDSLFVECSGNRWNQIDSLLYYLGHCSRVNYKGEHNGSYYSCQGTWSNIDDTTWREIYPPEYYNDKCDLNRIVEYDSSYYICEQLKCEGDGCFAFRTWRKLEDTELIPPVLNMDTCGSPQENLKIVYDDVFYECKDGKWETVPEDSLLPPEKDGLACDDSLSGVVKKYGSYYYACKEYQWKTLSVKESLPYLYRDSLGSCDTISNKLLLWDKERGGFFGCTLRDSVYKWDAISVGTDPYTLPKKLDVSKLAGNTLGDSTYEATVDGVVYHFNIRKMTYTQPFYNLILSQVDFGGKSYAAYSYGGRLFLHGERGKDSLMLSSIENPSASFTDFYANWKKRIVATWRGSNPDAEVPDSSVSVLMYNEDTFMTYEQAKAFCPKGFHIPSEMEFEKGFRYGTSYLDLRNDSPIRWYFKGSSFDSSTSNEIYADIFWTSTEKDADTQYCYETTIRTVTMDVKGTGVVECPKDLYPMVQAMCVMDD